MQAANAVEKTPIAHLIAFPRRAALLRRDGGWVAHSSSTGSRLPVLYV